jgi:hypothetical protein
LKVLPILDCLNCFGEDKENFMKSVRKNWKMIVAGMLILLHFTVSIGKTSAQSGSTSPVSDFSFDLSEDGEGIKITGYTGNGGAVAIPSEIEDLPVVEIGQLAFTAGQSARRQAVTSLTVPSSVVIIGMRAFSYLADLEEVTLPDGLKIIPGNLFSACKSLRKVNLPASLEAIHGQAFSGCGELVELAIPESLAGIKFMDQYGDEEVPDNFAFAGCGKLPIRIRQRLQKFGYESWF